MKNNVIHLSMRSPFTIFAPKLRPMDIASVIQSPISAELEDFRQLFERSLSSSNPLLIALLCAMVGGLLSNLAVFAGLGDSADSISIGNIMLLIPGMAFTNSIRDIFSKDMITGVVRFVEAVVLAIVIALGFTFTNFL